MEFVYYSSQTGSIDSHVSNLPNTICSFHCVPYVHTRTITIQNSLNLNIKMILMRPNFRDNRLKRALEIRLFINTCDLDESI